MKVGTDGVLLGAWADVQHSRNLLDIGCGSGLIALMLAQRNAAASVTGIELDEAAAADARQNVSASPFAQQVHIVCGNVLTYPDTSGGAVFDHIVSNPPYHEEELLPPSARRAAARHTSGGGLTFAALLHTVSQLIAPVLNLVSASSCHSPPFPPSSPWPPFTVLFIAPNPCRNPPRQTLQKSTVRVPFASVPTSGSRRTRIGWRRWRTLPRILRFVCRFLFVSR